MKAFTSSKRGWSKLQGQLAKNLFSGTWPAGTQLVEWDGSDASKASVPNGIYVIKCRSQQEVMSKRLILLRN